MQDGLSKLIEGTPASVDRRNMLRGTGVSALALGALAATGVAASVRPASAQAVDDAAIVNFALNLEYLEAEYYVRAVTGQGLADSDRTGVGNLGRVVGGRQVKFETRLIKQFAAEIAQDELAHVRFLRAVLGAGAVAAPSIDLENSFNTLAQAAGLGPSFDPYADENSFLLGAYIFEDVGVTAYRGAAPLVESKDVLSAAAGILAVEAYHASEVRVLLLTRGFAEATQKISALRAALSGAEDDQGVLLKDGAYSHGAYKRDANNDDANKNRANKGVANIVPTDENSLTFSRTARQVLNIVYGAPNASGGLFFPEGANGTIR